MRKHAANLNVFFSVIKGVHTDENFGFAGTTTMADGRPG
jgi:hypothetical protein